MSGNVQIRLRHAGQKEAAVTLEATYAEFFSSDGSVEFFSVLTQDHETILKDGDGFCWGGETFDFLHVIAL